jgi:hypothetical protein
MREENSDIETRHGRAEAKTHFCPAMTKERIPLKLLERIEDVRRFSVRP